jgi:hypothetical protein
MRINSQTISQASVFYSIILMRLAIVRENSVLMNPTFPIRTFGSLQHAAQKKLEK